MHKTTGILDTTNPLESRALAAPCLTSYRCKGPYGYIMIGAKDHPDALREALRSSHLATRDALEIWDGAIYTPIPSHT